VKKFLSILLIFVYVITLSGCKNEAGQAYFNAKVLEVNKGFVNVKCLEEFNSGIPVDEEFSVTTDVVASKGTPEIKVDDNIRVVFNGEIMESYPLQLGTVYAIYLLDENGDVIPND
jgi:hypothetical protein